jgi:putative inorganic carbon (hco3(-)) transporter
VRVRGNGFMNDPNDLALGIVLALPLCWALWKQGRRVWNTICVWTPTGVMVTTLYYTKSRGGMLALLAVLGIMWSRRLGRTKTAILLALVMAAMFAMSFTAGRSLSDDSTENRLEAWREGFHMFATHPVLGVGMAGFVDRVNLTAHNSFVLCFSETGFLGYFLWTLIVVASMLQVLALERTDAEGESQETVRRWARALRLSMCGFLVGGFFLSRTYICLFYLLAATICALTVVAVKLDPKFSRVKLGSVLRTSLVTAIGVMATTYVVCKIDGLFS